MSVFRRLHTASQRKKEGAAIAAAATQAQREAQQPSGYGTELQVLCGHTDIVRHMVRVDDRLLVSAGDDRTAIVWDYHTGERVHTLVGHKHPITCMLLLDDKAAGPLLLTGSSDKSIRVWDLQTGVCTQTLQEHEGSVKCLCAMHDPSPSSGSSQNPLQQQLPHLPQSPQSPRSLSPSSGAAIPAVVGTTDPSLSTSSQQQTGDESGATAAMTTTTTTTGRQQHWFCSGGNDKHIHIWHQGSDGVVRRTGTIVRVDEENMGCMLAVNERFVVTASSTNNVVQVYSLRTMAQHRYLSYHREAPQCFVRLSDTAFVSGSLDGMIVVWHAEHMTPLRVLNSPGDYVGKEDHDFRYCVRTLVFVAGQFLLAAIGNGFAMYDVASGDVVVHADRAHATVITALAMAHSGTHVLTASDDATIKIWALPAAVAAAVRQARLAGGAPSFAAAAAPRRSSYSAPARPVLVRTLQGHSSGVTQLAPLFGSAFASCSADHYVILWKDGAEQTELRNNHAALLLLQQSSSATPPTPSTSTSTTGTHLAASPFPERASTPGTPGTPGTPLCARRLSGTSTVPSTPVHHQQQQQAQQQTGAPRRVVPLATSDSAAASPSASVIVAASPTAPLVRPPTGAVPCAPAASAVAAAGEGSDGRSPLSFAPPPQQQQGQQDAEGVSQCLVDYAAVLLQEKQYSEAQIEAELRASGCTPEVIARIREQLVQQQRGSGGSDADSGPGEAPAPRPEAATTTTVIDNEASSEQPPAGGFGIPSVLRKLFY